MATWLNLVLAHDRVSRIFVCSGAVFRYDLSKLPASLFEVGCIEAFGLLTTEGGVAALSSEFFVFVFQLSL